MRKALSLVILFLTAFTVNATDVGIMPLGAHTVETDANHTLTLTNRSSEPVKMQVRVYAWSQVDGKDVLAPTTDLMASPAIISMAPGVNGKIRLRRVGKGHNFRVLLTELPKPVSEGATAVGFRLEYSLPYLFEPVAASQALLAGKMVNGRLVLTNTGGKAAKITSVGPANSQPWANTRIPNAGWVLAGSIMEIAVPATADRIQLMVDTKPLILTVQ